MIPTFAPPDNKELTSFAEEQTLHDDFFVAPIHRIFFNRVTEAIDTEEQEYDQQ